MNIREARAHLRSGTLDEVEVRRSPADISQWFVMGRQHDGKSMILVDEQDSPLVESDLEALLGLLREIGCRDVRVVL